MNHLLINQIPHLTPLLVTLTIYLLSPNKRDALHNLTGLNRFLHKDLMSCKLRLLNQNLYLSLNPSLQLNPGILDESEGPLLALTMSMVINTLQK